MIDILRTIASAGEALDNLYNSMMNSRVNLYNSKFAISDTGNIIMECDGVSVEFASDGVVYLIDRDGVKTTFDNHCYKWPKLADALEELFTA